MQQNRRVTLAAAFVIVWAGAGSAGAQDQSNLARCRIEAARGSAAIARSYLAGRATCLRFLNYSDCPLNYPSPEQVGALLRTSACEDAVYVDNAPIAEIYPALGWPFWYDYPLLATEVDHTAWAHAINMRWLTAKAFYDLDLPSQTPPSSFERKCVRAALSVWTKTVAAGVEEQIACAQAGGEPPWNCPIVSTGESRLARAVTSIGKKMSRCRDAGGVAAAVSGESANLCNKAVTTPDDLAACLAQSALCQVCAISTSTLGTGHDCAAVSGDRDCNPQYGSDFGKQAAGSFAVANEGDDSITSFSAWNGYAYGDLAASTLAVGASPVDVVISERANTIASVNRDDNSVTLLNAHDGSWLSGSLPSSTIVVGTQPSAALVHPESDFLYVTNRGDGTVTFLDAWDGSYAYSTLIASSFPSGAGPSALALNSDGTILYVANADDDTVTFLDARSGLPALGSLALSTFVVGSAPSGLAVFPSPTGERLAVTNEEDDTVSLLDAASGLLADATPAASTRAVAAGPTAIAALDYEGSNLFVASTTTPAISALHEGDPWPTNDGPVADATVVLEHPPGDVALGAAAAYRLGAPARLLVTSPDEDLVFSMPVLNAYGLAGPSDAERSLVPIPPDPLYVAANLTTPGFYVMYAPPNTYDPLLFVDASGEVQWEVGIPQGATGVAYSEATDTVFVGTYAGVLYLDGSNGAYRFGTLEASTFACGCNGQPRVVDDVSGTLYVTCQSSIAFMSTTDGSCTTATTPAIVVSKLQDVALDRDNGILYVAFSYYTGTDTRYVVVRHDAATGAWFDGTYEDSVVFAENHWYDYYYNDYVRLALNHDGSTLYVFDGGGDELSAIDTGTFAVLASRPTSETGDPLWMFGGGTAGDPLMLFRRLTTTAATRPSDDYYSDLAPRFDDVLYLDGDTLAYAAGDLASSRLMLGETDGGYAPVPTFAYNHATRVIAQIAYDAAEGINNTPRENVGPGLVLLDPAGPSFSWSLSAAQAGLPLATGDRPGAIAVMPAHTQADN